MEWIRNNRWWILITIIIVTITIGVIFFIFSPKKQSIENVVATPIAPVPSVVSENKKIVEERAKLPIPPDVDPQAWPEKTILKTPQGLNRIIVHFKYGVASEAINTVIQKYGARVVMEFSSDPYSKSVFVPESQRDALSKDPAVYGVENDEPIKMIQSQVTPDGVKAVKAPEAWGQGITGSGIKVCVIDSGVDLNNQDLIDHIGYSWSPTLFKYGINDQTVGHGTHVAGTISANNNTDGVVGVAPDVDLCIIRVFDDEGNTTNSILAEGFQKAIDKNARVINYSGGSQSEIAIIHNVVADALAKGIVVVAAAGNPDPGGLTYPGRQNGVISVSAVTNSGSKESDYPDGPTITLVAPGVSVLSDCPPTGVDCTDRLNSKNRTAFMDGTSMASPHVAGVVALLLSQPINAKYDVNKDNKWQPAEVINILTDTATDLGASGKDDIYGYGLVNVQKIFAANAPLSCIGITPENADLCSGDDAGLTTGDSKTLVSACTTTTKCEYTCKNGFSLSGSTCVAVVPPVIVPPVIVPPVIVPPVIVPPPASISSGGIIPCGRNSGTPAEMAPCTICHIIVGGSGIITWGLRVMTIIGIVVIVAMAILYIVSAGDEGLMSTAKGGIKAAFIGFAVMLAAWLIVMTVLRVTSASVPGLGITATGFTFSCDTSR